MICLGAKCSSAASLESILFNSLNKSSLTKDEERRLTCSAGVKEVSGSIWDKHNARKKTVPFSCLSFP